MAKPKAQTRNPRITAHKNGLSTLTGMRKCDLHSILTAAAIHLQDQYLESMKRNEPKEAQFYTEMLSFIVLAEKSVTRNEDRRPLNPRDLSKADRFDLVRVQASSRKHIERVVDEFRKNREKMFGKV